MAQNHACFSSFCTRGCLSETSLQNSRHRLKNQCKHCVDVLFSILFQALQQLRDDIEEKDSRLTSLSKQLDDLENQLQKTRQDLYIEQMHSSELESEVGKIVDIILLV